MIPYAGAPKRRGHWPKGKPRKTAAQMTARLEFLLPASEKCAVVAQAHALGISTTEYVRLIISEDIERRMKSSPVPEHFRWPPNYG